MSKFMMALERWCLFFSIIMVLLLPLSAAAEVKSTFTPTHLAAAERLVYAMGMYESLTIPTKRVIRQLRSSDPAKAELLATVAEPFLEKEFIGGQFKEFMAGQFDLETCRQLVDYWEGPVGRRFVATQVQLLSTGKAEPLKFTPEEETLGKRFEKTRAFANFSRAMPAIEERLAGYGKEMGALMAARMKEELARRK